MRKLQILDMFNDVGAVHKAMTNTMLPFALGGTMNRDAKRIEVYARLAKLNTYSLTEICEDKVIIEPKLWEAKQAILHFDKMSPNVFYKNDVVFLSLNVDDLKGDTDPLAGFNRALEQCDEPPHFIILESVKRLVNLKHVHYYLKWQEFLSKLGYKVHTTTINPLDYGYLQNRDRLFGIAIMRSTVDMPDTIFQNWFKRKYQRPLTLEQRAYEYDRILKASDAYPEELAAATPNDTPSRHRFKAESTDLGIPQRNIRTLPYTFETVAKKQDRIPNAGIIMVPKQPGKMDYRYLTPRQCFLIMGFDHSDFCRIKTMRFKGKPIGNAALYRMAGESHAVGALTAILRFIYDYVMQANFQPETAPR